MLCILHWREFRFFLLSGIDGNARGKYARCHERILRLESPSVLIL
jgi:hypothetical protein